MRVFCKSRQRSIRSLSPGPTWLIKQDGYYGLSKRKWRHGSRATQSAPQLRGRNMLSSLFLSALAFSTPGGTAQDVIVQPVIVARPHPNFILPGPYVPNFYPLVPSPVVIAHPNWYYYPGPAYWYANNISPYNPVNHKPTILVPLPPPKVEKR